MVDHLKNYEIPSAVYYPVPLHAQKAYADPQVISSNFIVTNRLVNEVISLPMHSELTNDQISFIATKVLEFFEQKF